MKDEKPPKKAKPIVSAEKAREIIDSQPKLSIKEKIAQIRRTSKRKP